MPTLRPRYSPVTLTLPTRLLTLAKRRCAKQPHSFSGLVAVLLERELLPQGRDQRTTKQRLRDALALARKRGQQ